MPRVTTQLAMGPLVLLFYHSRYSYQVVSLVSQGNNQWIIKDDTCLCHITLHAQQIFL